MELQQIPLGRMLLSGSKAYERYVICREATSLIQEIITITELTGYNWSINHRDRNIEFLVVMCIMEGVLTKAKITFSFNFDGNVPNFGYYMEFRYLQLICYKNEKEKLFDSRNLDESATKIREYLARL